MADVRCSRTPKATVQPSGYRWGYHKTPPHGTPMVPKTTFLKPQLFSKHNSQRQLGQFWSPYSESTDMNTYGPVLVWFQMERNSRNYR